mmetsp:Transcript_13770/g.40427  ORF Transcript_13770/g.40427 Transcript_13770/m.40427 type:complete len:340 (+) Transcript_13770:99-1118(+)
MTWRVLLAFAAAAAAFAPAQLQQPRLSSATAPALLPARPLAATRPLVATRPARHAQPAMFLGVRKALISVPVLYVLMSLNEYATHRWYQHEEFNRNHAFNRFFQRLLSVLKNRPMRLPDGRANLVKLKGGGHVEHHAETYDDMSLKKDKRWRQTKAAASLDSDIARGTAFSWAVTGMMTVQMLPSALPVFALLGFGLLETLAVLLPGMLVHALVWNMLHPPMHGLPPVKLKYGAPSWPLEGLRDTAYFKYIYENHQGHHVLGGQANYNVCCPLTDHLFGTYVPTATWVKRMRKVPGPEGERWGIPLEPKGVPQAPIIAAGKATERDFTPTALLNAPEPA